MVRQRRTRRDKGRKRGKNRRRKRVLKKYPNTLVALQRIKKDDKYKSEAKKGAELGAVSGAAGAIAKGAWDRKSLKDIGKDVAKSSFVGAVGGGASGSYLTAKNKIRTRIIRKARSRVKRGHLN